MSIEDYEPVASRLARFWEKHPEGRVITKLLTFEGDRVIVQADIYFDREDDRPVATDFAEEIRGSNNVNKTSFIENACTSAIGRALSDCDFASADWTKRPSREEMQKVERMTSRPTEGGNITEPSNLASDKQLNMIRAVCKSIGRTVPNGIQGWTKKEASAFIDTIKSNPPAPEHEPEEAF
jgi:hypothetical protein